MASANSGNSAAVCSGPSLSGSCYVNDAFGVTVEVDNPSTDTQIVRGPGGFTQFYNGSSVIVRQSLPGGGTLVASGTGLQTLAYLHPDWLGSARLTTLIPGRSQLYDGAYSPYGRAYASFGTSNPNYLSFTGDFQDAFSGLWETDNRQLFVNAGR